MAKRKRPEAKIQAQLRVFLEDRGWLTESMHGNAFQVGIPDLFCFHKKFGYRWIDCKVRGRYSFTKAQKHKWPQWEKKGVGIWILVDATEEEYDKLIGPPNWRDYWKKSWGELVPMEELLASLNNETTD